MNEIELTKKLISIPSYVDKTTDESIMVRFLYDYLKENLKDTEINLQKVEGQRSNIIVSKGNPKLLVVGHIDTVQPRNGWNTDPLRPIEKDGKILGLGANDMKGSLASFITALVENGVPEDFMFLIYIDEEYDFLGMKRFVKEYKNKIKPNFVLSIDGGGPNIGYGCKGCIEITFKVLGKTGHAASPLSGINAIRISTQAVNKLEEKLNKLGSNELGKSTVNLAYLKGGLNLDEDEIGKQGNNIADIAEFVIDVRTNGNVDAKEVINMVIKSIEKQNGKVVETKIRHNLSFWKTDQKEINWLKSITKEKYSKCNFELPFGYIDTQMIWEMLNKVNCATFGAGPGGNQHASDEWISVNGLTKTKAIYKEILKRKF
jgi:succinyl-diaminopimelate desuccinylase